jgi:hypothetical protein
MKRASGRPHLDVPVQSIVGGVHNEQGQRVILTGHLAQGHALAVVATLEGTLHCPTHQHQQAVAAAAVLSHQRLPVAGCTAKTRQEFETDAQT